MGKRIKTADELIMEEFGVEPPTSTNSTDKKKEDNVIHTSFFETKDYILEQIKPAGVAELAELSLDVEKPVFVKYSKLNGDVKIVKEENWRDKKILPIIDDTYTKGGILLPSGISYYTSVSQITQQIKSFLLDNCELPKFFENLFPHLILFYWMYEKFPFIPYIHFVGGTATGKTTAMDVFGSICYKPIDTTGSLTIASIFRLATSWRGTLLIDEFDSVGENSKEITAFLKSGVSDRLVLRTEGEIKKEVKAYIVKSPKIFTSENPINDAGLQSRTIVVRMQKNIRRLPLFKLPEYYKEAQDIRNKLLLWRLRNYNNIQLKDIKYGFQELEAFDRRVQQIITPVYYFSDEETKKEILEFAKEQEMETKRERRESLVGKIFVCILSSWDEGNDAQIKDITKKINEDNIGYKELTEKKVSNEIRKILGFDTQPTGHDKLSTVIKNEQLEAQLKDYYGISSSEVSSATFATSAEEKIAKEVFDID
jgi:hypothetical protein